MTEVMAAAIIQPRISSDSRSLVLAPSMTAKKTAVAQRYQVTSTQMTDLLWSLTCTTASAKPTAYSSSSRAAACASGAASGR